MVDAKLDTDTEITAVAAAETETVDVLARSLTADSTIKNYVIASVGASIIPVPLVDIAAVVGIQLRMIQKLSQLYGQPFSERIGRSVIASLAGGVIGYGAGVTVAVSLTKIIPGVGWMLGMASLPLVAGGTTYAIGHVFAKHFEDGGTMLDISPSKMQAYYREQFEKGKRMAAAAKTDLETKRAAEQSAA
ncbi:YcjF family protein [Xanthobacteraceae bacterium A53D]